MLIWRLEFLPPPPNSADLNSDGIPDNPFSALSGESVLWLADVVDYSKGYDRVVGVRRFEFIGPGQTAAGVTNQEAVSIVLDLGSGISVTVSCARDVLIAGETGVLIVAAGSDAVAVLGSVEGAGLEAPEYRQAIPGAPVVEVSLLVSGDGGATFAEVDAARLSASPIRIVVEGLVWDVPEVANPGLIEMPFFVGYPTYAASTVSKGVHFLAESGVWRSVATTTLGAPMASGDSAELVSMEASLSELSLFVPTLPAVGLTNAQATGTGSGGGGTGGTEDGDGGGGDGTGLTLLEPGGAGGEGGGGLEEPGLPEALTLNTSEVWVDFAHLGDELGTEGKPFNTLVEGVNAVDVGGAIYVKAGDGDETMTVNKDVTIHAVGGSMSSGDPDAIQEPSGLDGIVVASYDDSRVPGGIGGGLLGGDTQDLAAELQSHGIIIIEVPELSAETLEGVDVFFSGLPDGSQTQSEQDALFDFAQAGGGLLILSEGPSADLLTSLFGVTSIPGYQGNDAEIIELEHPVMQGRFGLVDNDENEFRPLATLGLDPGSALVLAETVDNHAAIVAVESGLGRGVIFNDWNFLRDGRLDLEGNKTVFMNALLWVLQDPLVIEDLDSGEDVERDGIVYVTAEPSMPNLVARYLRSNGGDPVEMALEIRYQVNVQQGAYTKLSDDVVHFPDATGEYESLNAPYEWNLRDEYSENFSGGEVTLHLRLDSMSEPDEFTFKIRGENPEDADVIAYIESAHTFNFLPAMVRHESYVPHAGPSYQFNQFNPAVLDNDQVDELPNYGGPDGWGLMQLDGNGLDRQITTEELWNWRTNVDSGIEVLESKFAALDEYVDAMERIYPDEYENPRIPGAYTHDVTIQDVTTTLTMEEASVIQRYNGGRGLFEEFMVDENGEFVLDQNGDRIVIARFAYAWEFNPEAPAGSKWTFGPNQNNYVHEIVEEYLALQNN